MAKYGSMYSCATTQLHLNSFTKLSKNSPKLWVLISMQSWNALDSPEILSMMICFHDISEIGGIGRCWV